MRTSDFFRPALPALPLLLALVGCGGEGEAGPVHAIRDSAGVTIVETLAVLPLDAEGWRVAEEPALVLGGGKRGRAQDLRRVVGGTVLADGGVAVATPKEILLFSPQGNYRSTLGGPGRGAGELAALTFMGKLGGDTIVAFDEVLRRISLFHPRKGPLGSVDLPASLSPLSVPVGLLGRQGMVFRAPVSDSGQGLWSGRFRGVVSFLSVPLSGAEGKILGRAPGPEVWRTVTEGNVVARPIPFGAEPVAAAGRGRLFFSRGDRYEITVVDGEGDRVSSFRSHYLPLLVEEEDALRLVQGLVDRIAGESLARAALIREYMALPLPEHTPPLRSMTVDVLGFLWVEDYRRPRDTVAVWTVFDPQGRGVARVSLPAGHELLEVGAAHILALHVDPRGIESVCLYPLSRPAAPPGDPRW